MPIIAVSGPHGSGKSTAARNVAEILGFKYISAGELFRDMAKEQNMNLEEFSRQAELKEEIDRYIDNKTLELGQTRDNVVIDAQLGGWMLKEEADMLVYVTAPFDIRVQRIAQRENKPIETIIKETKAREESEKSRYQKLYKIDITDLTIYDLIVNSEKFDVAECVEIILTAYNEKIKGEK